MLNRKYIKLIGLNIVLAMTYIATGKLGLMMALPPGFVTIIWPPSGIALGMLLVFGVSLWPGLLIGSFVLNCYVAGLIEMTELPQLNYLLVPMIIATGSTLQALCGKSLLEKLLKFPVEITNTDQVLKFVFISVPLSCLVAASVGNAALCLGGIVSREALFESWAYWWFGDVLGIVVFTPLVLILLFKNPKLSFREKPLGTLPNLALVMIVLSLTLTFYGYKIALQIVQERANADFNKLVLESENALHSRLDSYRHALLGGAGFFLGSDYVSRSEWRDYVNEIDVKNNFPGIKGIGFIEAVPPNELDLFAQQTKSDGLEKFRIHPVTDGPYYIIKYIEPEIENREAVGLNIAFEKNRRDAAQLSVDTATDTITKKVYLVQEAEKTPGFLLLHPLYKNNLPTNNPIERQQALMGWVYAPFVANQFLNKLTESQGQDFHLTIFDGEIANAKKIIYSSIDRPGKNFSQNRFVIQKTINVFNQKWLVVWNSSSKFDSSTSSLSPKLVLFGGLLFTFLLAAFLVVTLMQSQSNRIEKSKPWSLTLPWVLFVLMTAASLSIYNTLKKSELNFAKELAQAEARKINRLIDLAVTDKVLALQRMAQRWVVANGTPFEQWKADADRYIKHINGLKAVEWIDNTYHVKWVEPLETNQAVVGLNILFDEQRKNDLNGAAESENLTLTSPLDLVQGYKGFVSYAPIKIDGKFEGFIAGVFSVNEFINNIIENEISSNFLIQIQSQGNVFYENQLNFSRLMKNWAYESEMSVFNQNWVVKITPKYEFVNGKLSHLPLIVLFAGVAISFLMSLTLRYVLYARAKSNQLQISEERLQLLVDGAKEYAIYMLDPQGNVNSWNSGAQNIKGYAADEILGKHFSIFYTEDARKQGEPERVLQMALRDGQYENSNCLRVKRDGSLFRAHVVLDPLYNESKTLIGFVKITRDVTVQNEQAEKLQELSNRLELATHSAQIGVWDWNIQTNELIWDDVMIALYGIDKSDFSGAYQAWENGVHPDDVATATAAINKAVATKEKFSTTFRVLWPDKTVRHIRAIANVVCDATGQPIKMVGVNWDVTIQVEAEQRLRAIVLGAPNAMVMFDEQKNILMVNQQAEQLFGYKEDELVGSGVQKVFLYDINSAKSGLTESQKNYVINKFGNQIPIEIGVSKIKSADGLLTLVSILDLTERNKIDQMKNEFVSTVSHELRTPLTSIRGSLGLIAGNAVGEAPEKMKPLIQIALSNCERLIRMINDILDVEKIESGKMEFKVQKVDLIDIVNSAVQTNLGYAKTFEVELKQNNPIVDHLFVNVDQDKIIQVITNLISNAVKFSPRQGLVTISVTHDEHLCRLSVEDQGTGIPEEFRDKIFNKFAQADSSNTRQNGGTGLGLSICKAIIEQHGGKIGFDSKTNVGSRFYFELPLFKNE